MLELQPPFLISFNIRGEGSVIQTSLKGGECNLLLKQGEYSLRSAYHLRVQELIDTSDIRVKNNGLRNCG